MEDSFRVRVDKTFNSLSSSSSSQTLASSLWCLTDEEIEKRQWSREPDASIPVDDDDDDDDDNERFLASDAAQVFFAAKDGKSVAPENNPNPNPNLNDSDTRKELEEDLKELDDDGGEGTSTKNKLNECRAVVCSEEDELDVKETIGMDCTLDFEDEEDQYDKVAVGAEKNDQHLFMSDMIDCTSDVSPYNELPGAFKEASRDPRANYLGAKLRLKEDAETARSFNSLHVSDQTDDDVSVAENDAPEDENLPRSILKRKDDQMDSKNGKRVRFEPICKTDDNSTFDGDKIVSRDSNIDFTLYKDSSSPQHDSSTIPDYVRHPLRYTHYTFDSASDMNEESNRQAYVDFLNMVKKSKSEPDEVPADLTKPVIFNLKKKTGDVSLVTGNKSDHIVQEPVQKKSISLSIAAGNIKEDEASEMEVDEHEITVGKVGNGRRMARKYRSKVIAESNELYMNRTLW